MIVNYFRPDPRISYLKGMLSVFLVLPGILLIVWGIYYGVLFFIFCLVLFTLRKGSEIDFEEKRIRLFDEILWMKAYSKIEVKKYSGYRIKIESSVYAMRGGRRWGNATINQTGWNGTTIHQKFYSLEIYSSTYRNYELIATDDKKSINEMALKLEEVFGYSKIDKKRV